MARYEEFAQPILDDTKNIRFIVVPLCKEPEQVEEINAFLPNSDEISSYIGFDTNLKQSLPMKYKHSNYRDKIKVVEKLLKNKLIIFKTNIIVNEEIDKRVKNDGYRDSKIFKNIEVSKILELNLNEDNEFVRVPKLNIRGTDFISKLRNGDFIELAEYPTYLEMPEYIICDNNIYYFNNNDWNRHSSNKNMWSYEGNLNDLQIYDMINNTSNNSGVILCSNYTYFINKQIIDNNPGRMYSLTEIADGESIKEVIYESINISFFYNTL